ncbi:MAG: flagellar hook-basal body protein [Desulfobacteraceae bacterium 4572_19]|nr:MAG: flagellar hook-basal body protein [Desulfobacteraceae bacterium 4572_19]
MILEMTRPVQGGLRQERQFDVVANHLANIDTTGFKGDILSFDRMFKAQMNVDLTQGPVKETGGKLDMALEDEGFFKIKTQRGVRYTRNGNFTLSGNGTLVTKEGDPVLADGQPVVFDQNNIENIFVHKDGNIEAYSLTGGLADLGKLDVVTFKNLEKIEKEGSSLFIYNGDVQDEIPPDNISVKQGALEMSNVTSVTEMVKMIEEHRMYESYQKMIQTFDATDEKAVNEVGKLQ